MEENGWIIVAVIGAIAIIWVIVNGTITAIKDYKKQKIQEMINDISGTDLSYLKTFLNAQGFNAERCIQYSKTNTFVADNNKKEFGIANYSVDRKRLCDNLLSLTDEQLKQFKTNKESFFEYSKPFVEIEFDKRFNYVDLVKYDVVDKTKVDKERTFIQESNQNDVIAGAIVGDAIGNPINGAIVGAMVGNAGEKRVHEKVKTTTTVLFDIVITLNKFDIPSVSLTLFNERNVREISGVLDFILNNK